VNQAFIQDFNTGEDVAARLGGEEAEAPKAPSSERRRRENRGACAEGEGVSPSRSS
jgi:hypothetical protein